MSKSVKHIRTKQTINCTYFLHKYPLVLMYVLCVVVNSLIMTSIWEHVEYVMHLTKSQLVFLPIFVGHVTYIK